MLNVNATLLATSAFLICLFLLTWHGMASCDNAIKVNFEGQINGRDDFHKQIVLGLKQKKKKKSFIV